MTGIQLPAYNPEKETVVVQFIKNFPSAPYYVQKLTSWGLSSGTCYRTNTFSNNLEYRIYSQQNGYTVYIQ